ncbi:MAG: Xaa-Pro peptidase family protein [Planctomycetia bacterium]|nr:Xaa-Pro peptidase family protein [Planctomycetia bacterium]
MMKKNVYQRCDKLRKMLKKEKLGAFLVTNFTNVTWLTGFTGDDSYLLVTPEGQTLLSDSRYTLQIARECPGLPVEIRSQSMSAMIKQLLEKNCSSPCTLAVESNSVTLSQAEALRREVTSELVPVSGWVEKLRSVKDRAEIAKIREAGRIARNAFHVVRASLTPDKTEKQIADEMENVMRKLGAKRAGFPTIVAVGANAALCHCVPGDVRVKDADFLLIDWGAEYQGYTSDLTRVLITGKPSAEFRKIYRIVLEAQRKAIEAIRPGVRCCDVDRVARSYISRRGYGKCFGHGLGHGIGLYIHESPSFSAGCDTVLEPGMVLTVEPGIYIEGMGGVRIEDDIVVTRNGCEVLTDVEKDWDDMFVH